jgi:hypothetical protein
MPHLWSTPKEKYPMAVMGCVLQDDPAWRE